MNYLFLLEKVKNTLTVPQWCLMFSGKSMGCYPPRTKKENEHAGEKESEDQASGVRLKVHINAR